MARWKTIEEKFKNLSKDITFSDAVTLLEHYGYTQDNKGRTSGSRVRFISDKHCDILLHKPHPQKELKGYVIRDLHNIFEQEGFWNE
ncbi:MAG: type II toxin-antitoxin system HicA family toxin [Lachnospiraceae bacterium]|nr:type II toxin-antitoxin system HicA family toxin [Lachnospiraceae bacterium]